MRRSARLAVLLILAACVPDATVSAQLSQTVQESTANRNLRLSDATDFEWDQFLVFGPYTTRELADEALGFSWPDFDRFNLSMLDSFSLLVFVRDQEVVRVEKHPRCSPDFSPESLARGFSPDQAIFRIERTYDCAIARPAA